MIGISSGLSAQFTVNGTVTDADNGDPLIGVTVIVKGTTIGTITDLDGRYTVEVPGESGRLELSYVGYGSKVLDVSKSNPAGDLKMTSSTSTLDEVVITGLATTVARRNSANSVATMSDQRRLPGSSRGAKIFFVFVLRTFSDAVATYTV